MQNKIITLVFLSFCAYLGWYKVQQINLQRQWHEIRSLKAEYDLIKINQDRLEKSIEEKKQEVKKTYGKASYYDYTLNNGWSSKGHSVCASRDYKRGKTLVVKNLANGKVAKCLVTDYGPNKAIHPDRIIDLSSHTFSQISTLNLGVINVQVYEEPTV